MQDDSPHDLSVVKTVQLIVEAVNDGPSIAGPDLVEAEEDTPVSLPGVRVEDPDCDDAPRGMLEVSITASNGTVQFLGSVAGLYLMEAPPGSLKIRGKTNPVNAALAGLSYTGAPEFSGDDSIVVTADDMGNSGDGGQLRAMMSVYVTVAAVNDAPEILVPPELDNTAGGVLFVVEDTSTPLGAFGVSDPDDAFLRVTVSTRVGIVTIDGFDEDSLKLKMLNDQRQAGTGSSVTLEGASDEVNAAFTRLTYTSALNWNSVAQRSRDIVEVSFATMASLLRKRERKHTRGRNMPPRENSCPLHTVT